MPYTLSRRTAVIAAVTLLALSFAVIAAAAVAPGSISFTSATYQIEEGGGDALITLSRSGGADGVVTAKVTLEGGTATGGVDYRRPSPGSVDPALNIGSGPTSTVRDVAVQPDGKILIGGLFWSYNGVTRNGIARLNADGSLDNTFPSPEMRKDVFCIVLQPDGKILIGGVVSQYGTNDNRTGIARLNADGSFDSTFTPGTGVGAYGVDTILLLPDGKILIGGNFPTYNGTAVGKLARLNSDGTLDTSFNPGVGPDGGLVRDLLLQPDGKIIVGGWFTTFAGHSRNGVARINADGSYDAGFNPGTSIDNYNVEAIALQPDGKVLVGGGFYTNMIPSGNPTALTRLNADGTPDAAFPAPGYGTNFFTRAITLQPDGKILLGGTSKPSPTSDVAHWLDRRKADGTDDTTFNPGVNAFLNSGVNKIALQGDGRILVAGQFSTNFFTSTYRNLWRLEGDLFVTWNAGDTADKTVRLPVFQDTSHEENETVNLKVEALTVGSTSGPVTDATLVITDDDPTLGFAAATYSVSEDGGSVSIPVERAGYTGGTSTFTYSLPFGTANAGDFAHTPSMLTFAPGETTKTITIDITNDAVNERDETFSVQVGAVTGGIISRHSAVVTILNDDPLPTVSIADTTVVEADAGFKSAVFTVTRTGLIDRNVVVNVRTADGTAVAGEDYLSAGVPTQLFIAPNADSAQFTVNTYGDTIVEGDKTFTAEISTPMNATITRAQAVGTIKDNDTTTGVPTVQFGAREFKAQEGAGVATLVVTRSGDSSAPMNVNYSTALWVGTPGPGSAWDRNDYTYTLGTLRFAAGETSKEVQIFLTDDALVEGDELMSVALSAATGGASVGAPNAASVRIIDNDTAPAAANPIDDTAFFVRQHYRDFLGRDPDASGLAFWTGEIEGCGADAACREVKRVNVSAAFFLSIECQETGYYVYLLYKAAFNSGERVPFSSFAFDSQQVRRDVVVGDDGWEQRLASNKQEFADAFVARTNFLNAYPQSMTAAQFVDALNNNTGDPLNPTAGGSLTQAERDKLVADLTAGAITRAQALRAIAENAEYRRRQLSKAFVLMQYFGYLRRAPNAMPDVDFTGYNFWLGKLNEFQGNYINAEMVKAFINSAEYRKRFGQ
ncbi:MAG: Calx-beta domain-containing protein [Pyrinomonadaceae bacterium]